MMKTILCLSIVTIYSFSAIAGSDNGLAEAAYKGNLKKVQELLTNNKNTTSLSSNHNKALEFAFDQAIAYDKNMNIIGISPNHAHIIKLLINKGARSPKGFENLQDHHETAIEMVGQGDPFKNHIAMQEIDTFIQDVKKLSQGSENIPQKNNGR